ncbi:MAG: hypothetical protein GXY48_09740 [Methanomicrobiales archaeon]|nr:hypothetical protein [Methanomicrobiales archaeon]
MNSNKTGRVVNTGLYGSMSKGRNIMTLMLKSTTALVGLCICIILLFTSVSAATQPFGMNPVNSQSSSLSSLPIDIPKGIGTVGDDGNLHVNLVSQSSSESDMAKSQVVFTDNIAGKYQDKTMKKTTGVDGTLFEGGADIDYTIAPDNSVSGTVAYKFIEQGWTIKVKGTVHGQVSPNGNLNLISNDANVKYAGSNYPITMNVNAQYTGDQFEGTKVISAAGVTGTLDFTGTRTG